MNGNATDNFTKVRIRPVKDFPFKLEQLTAQDTAAFVTQATCPACGGGTLRVPLVAVGGDTIDEALKLVMCEQCSHVTYDKLPTDAWTEQFYKRVWDTRGQTTDYGKSPEPLPPGFWSHFMALNLPKNAHILDFGCGFGQGLLGLRALGYENLSGVELSEHRAKATEKYFPGRVKCGTVEAAAGLSKENGLFDLIVARHVFEHVREPRAVLAELKKLLKPSGLILLIVPDVYGETPIVTTLFLPHMHLYNRTSMLQMMKSVGLNPYAWTPSAKEFELVVVGSADPMWEPPITEHYSNAQEPVNAETIRRLADFIRAPWQASESNGPSFFHYFQPPEMSKHPAGFLPLNDNFGFSMFRMLEEKRILPFLGSKPFLGYVTTALLRKLDSNQSVLLNNMMGVEAIGRAEIPWIVGPHNETPILIK